MERTGGRQYAPDVGERETRRPGGLHERTGRYVGPARRGCRRHYVRSPHFDVAGWQHVDNRGYLKIQGRQGEQREAGMASSTTAPEFQEQEQIAPVVPHP